ncbi:MAG: glycosyltransferase [Aureispira sp.]
MMLFGEILLWICVYSLAHSYIIYPLLVRWAAAKKSNNQVIHQPTEELPPVFFVMSLYNEESVIAEKLITLSQSTYPSDKLHFYIGSDCSSDHTNALVADWANNNPQAHFYAFEERRGKPSVINDLIQQAQAKHPFSEDNVLIISDANVLVEPTTIYELAKHFKNPTIGLVDSNIQHPSQRAMNAKGIAATEDGYISREVYIKHLEGRAWGRTMGPLGGCYAIRAQLFSPVPANFLVDDFYIAMKVFEQGGCAINELEAVCYEVVSSDLKEEFRRKTRISAGNFANLAAFKHLLWPPTSSLAFAFLSHKVLRWLGPFFIIISYSCLWILTIGYDNQFYKTLLLLANIGLFGIPLLDGILKKFNINVVILRYITYFNAMNLALFNGFFKYLKGVQNGIWQPTKRNI